MIPNEVLKSIIEDGFGGHWKDNTPFTDVSNNHATEWINTISKSSGGLSTATQIHCCVTLGDLIILVIILLFVKYSDIQ